MARTAELLAVGTELLLGNILNSDARDLSRLLRPWASTSTTTRWWGQPRTAEGGGGAGEEPGGHPYHHRRPRPHLR